MKGFKLDSTGDIDIVLNENNKRKEIQLIDGKELIQQTLESVLGTNKGEWFLNESEGITFSNILGKNVDEEIIRNEIQQGLIQVDSSFVMTSFEMNMDAQTRTLKILFTAKNENGEEISGVTEYAN